MTLSRESTSPCPTPSKRQYSTKRVAKAERRHTHLRPYLCPGCETEHADCSPRQPERPRCKRCGITMLDASPDGLCGFCAAETKETP